jgi:P-type Cu2+ transporter
MEKRDPHEPERSTATSLSCTIRMDQATAALTAAVTPQVGIEDIEAEVLPEDKYRHVQALQRVVAMSGDGNDARHWRRPTSKSRWAPRPIAMNSARIVLVNGEPTGISRSRALSQKTMRNIRQNPFFAFIYNFIGVSVAAGVQYPTFRHRLGVR